MNETLYDALLRLIILLDEDHSELVLTILEYNAAFNEENYL